jgi:hypothetical protein
MRFSLANRGADTRLIQDYLGHKSITHTVPYTKLAPGRFVFERENRTWAEARSTKTLPFDVNARMDALTSEAISGCHSRST